MIPRELLASYLVANAVALGLLAVAFWRRDVARWAVVAVFGWAAVTNTQTVLSRPEVYLDFGSLTLSSSYREFIYGWFSRHTQAMVLAIAFGQVLIAALLASRRTLHRWAGAIGAWVFLLAIAPLGVGSGFPFSLTFGLALFVSLEDVEVHSARFRQVVHFLPRILSVLLVGLMIVLALDAFVGGQTTLDTMRAFGLHLIPAGIVLAIALLAWRWEWAGGVLFFALAVGYCLLADGRVSWMLVIAAPLVVTGALFLWSWQLSHRGAPQPFQTVNA
jgi:hypothetical protein